MADGGTGRLKCIVVTPDGEQADEVAEFVVLTAHDGQFGILRGRAALLCKLAPGMLRIDHGPTSQFYFVAGGFAEVSNNTVTVITPDTLPAEAINFHDIEHELQRVQNMPVRTEEEKNRCDQLLKTAKGKLATYVAYNQHGEKALVSKPPRPLTNKTIP